MPIVLSPSAHPPNRLPRKALHDRLREVPGVAGRPTFARFLLLVIGTARFEELDTRISTVMCREGKRCAVIIGVLGADCLHLQWDWQSATAQHISVGYHRMHIYIMAELLHC